PGDRVDTYRLQQLLGEGGMSTVWLATCGAGTSALQVALKVLRPGLADMQRSPGLDHEALILSRLALACVPRLLQAGIAADGQPYLALEYVAGLPITEHAVRHALSVERRIRLFLQACSAVSQLHEHQVVHRDLKPANVLVNDDGAVRLLDFGIAAVLDGSWPPPAHADAAVRSFTLQYAAPEQVRGEAPSVVNDVYALGVVLYELLAGTKPYRLRRRSDAESDQALLAVDMQTPSIALQRCRQDALEDAPSGEFGAELDTIVLKALEKEPTRRHVSVQALSLALTDYLDSQPSPDQPRLGQRQRGGLRRRPG
ncbi:MAG: serine/threonine protein kinase, partial [Pseudoxanthomonas sp.]|nr:serine/threonine protein kinase [Pseudoxanthomonas sp.]